MSHVRLFISFESHFSLPFALFAHPKIYFSYVWFLLLAIIFRLIRSLTMLVWFVVPHSTMESDNADGIREEERKKKKIHIYQMPNPPSHEFILVLVSCYHNAQINTICKLLCVRCTRAKFND